MNLSNGPAKFVSFLRDFLEEVLVTDWSRKSPDAFVSVGQSLVRGSVDENITMGAKASKKKGLSKEDLEFLVCNTHYEEDTISEWYRGFKQDCPDGKLNPDAFMKIYSKCFPMGKTSQFCDHVFRTFDTDRNGFIDFKEFLLAIDVTSSGTPEEKLSWAFKYVVGYSFTN